MLYAGKELLQVNAFEVQKSFNVIWNNGNDVIDRFWKCFDLTGENALRSINKKSECGSLRKWTYNWENGSLPLRR